MVTPNTNSGCLPSGRSLEQGWLEALWEMSDDVSPQEIKEACKAARKNAFHAKSEEEASSWRFVMDSLFTMYVERKAA